MTKAVLVARGGFIPDEDRILRPADRPGRPPFLRPVGANQSRDDGDDTHAAHRHLARLHDVAVLSTCHMTRYRTGVPAPCGPRHARAARFSDGARKASAGPLDATRVGMSVQSDIHEVPSSAVQLQLRGCRGPSAAYLTSGAERAVEDLLGREVLVRWPLRCSSSATSRVGQIGVSAGTRRRGVSWSCWSLRRGVRARTPVSGRVLVARRRVG